jgi:hypothetical protein
MCFELSLRLFPEKRHKFSTVLINAPATLSELRLHVVWRSANGTRIKRVLTVATAQ